jgi:hypothetical protein
VFHERHYSTISTIHFLHSLTTTQPSVYQSTPCCLVALCSAIYPEVHLLQHKSVPHRIHNNSQLFLHTSRVPHRKHDNLVTMETDVTQSLTPCYCIHPRSRRTWGCHITLQLSPFDVITSLVSMEHGVYGCEKVTSLGEVTSNGLA